MRIIKEKTLFKYCGRGGYKKAESAIRSWVYEVRNSLWNDSGELKAKYGNASIISSKRVVFSVKGNGYRLLVDIEYTLKLVFVVWFGTQEEYDQIDVKTMSYEGKSD
jgi:mRNA interferase HigB